MLHHLSFFLGFITLSIAAYEEKHNILPTSCSKLHDGKHLVQLMHKDAYNKARGNSDGTEEAPVVEVTCANGYTIIDPKNDPKIVEYFSTYHNYHLSFAGPDTKAAVDWENWWLPSVAVGMGKTRFQISEDCSTISDESSLQSFGEDTTYYMTGDNFGCNWPVTSMCDFDEDTLECYKCAADVDALEAGEQVTEYWGKCGHMTSAKNRPVLTSYCTQGTDAVLPSIGTSGRFCVAYKFSDDVLSKYPQIIDVISPQMEETSQVEEAAIMEAEEHSDLVEIPPVNDHDNEQKKDAIDTDNTDTGTDSKLLQSRLAPKEESKPVMIAEEHEDSQPLVKKQVLVKPTIQKTTIQKAVAKKEESDVEEKESAVVAVAEEEESAAVEEELDTHVAVEKEDDKELYKAQPHAGPKRSKKSSIVPIKSLVTCAFAIAVLALMGLLFAYYQYRNNDKSSSDYNGRSWSINMNNENDAFFTMERQPMLEQSSGNPKYVIV